MPVVKIIDSETHQAYQIEPLKAGENLMLCPKCSPNRKKQREKCLQWNAEKGVGQCYHCSTAFVEQKAGGYGKRESKEYALPVWKNRTELSDKAVKWFEGRMISQQTLRELKVYSDTEWMPQYGREVEVICFPYFMGGELRNIKYRGPGKAFKMVKDAELVFFNFDAINTAKEVIIVEGEMDALSFYDAGLRAVISVPNGAGARDLSYLDNCIDDLSGVETFYIASDMDEAGLRLRAELIRRIGSERCKIVTYKGYKDANELYMSQGGTALREAIDKAVEIPLSGVLDLGAHYDDIRLIFENGLPQANGIGIAQVDDLVRWKTGMLVIWTGIPSHGKSEMLDFLSVRLNALYGWKVAYFSPENMPYHKYHYSKLASKITGATFRKGYISDEDYEEAFDYIESNFKYIDAGDDYSVETVLDAAEALVRRCGIRILNIDPYNCFEHRAKGGESETQYIGRFLDSLARFAKKHDVLVNLVAHPKKMDRAAQGGFQIPNLYDINGSANFYNKADIGVTVSRNFTSGISTLIVQKVRFRDVGTTGDVELMYNLRNGRYAIPVSDVRELDNSNYLHANPTPEPSATTSAIQPNETFDCPF